MLKVLKTDLYRLFHSVPIYIFPCFLISGFIVSYVLNLIQNGTLKVEGSQIYVEQLFSDFSGYVLLLFVIFVLLAFCVQENKHEYRKNILGNLEKRYYTVISKFIIGTVVTVIYVVYDFLLNLLSALLQGAEFSTYTDIIAARDVTFADGTAYRAGEIVMSAGEQRWDAVFELLTVFLIHLAFIMMAILINELSHNAALICVLTYGFITGLLEELIMVGFRLLQTKLEILSDFDIVRYMLINYPYNTEVDFSYVGVKAIMAAVYIVLFAGLSILTIQKKDVT